MATDRDGRPAPPVGSKVRFNYTNGFTYEGVVTKIDPSPYITLAEDYQMFVGGRSWINMCPGDVKFNLGSMHDVVVVMKPSSPKEIKSGGIKICEREGTDFSNFLTSGTYSDLQIKCEGLTFSCHRVVVSANSPVFDAMLQNNMVEASSGTIEIRDMKPNVLKAILDCIYKNKIDIKDLKDDPDFVMESLAAAEMYNMARSARTRSVTSWPLTTSSCPW